MFRPWLFRAESRRGQFQSREWQSIIDVFAKLHKLLIMYFPSPKGWHTRTQEAALEVNKVTQILILAPGIDMEFVRIPAGKFLMGSRYDDTGARFDEKPQHEIHLDEYWMGRTPVTNIQFRAFVEATDYKTTADIKGFSYIWMGSWERCESANWEHPEGPDTNIANKDNHPVVHLSWQDTVAFCQWASDKTGTSIRLPSEAEWEKTARGDQDDRKYPWGDEQADSNRCNIEMNIGTTTPVGQYSPQGDTPYGCADMSGNVWEWVNDWFDENYYQKSPFQNPHGPKSGKYRILRGGSWYNNSYRVRVSHRNDRQPHLTRNGFGFRCAYST